MKPTTPIPKNRFTPRSPWALRLRSVLLAAALLLTSLWTASCSPSSKGGVAGNHGFSDTVGHKIICTAEDFDSLKNEWFGTKRLVSDRAISAHQDTLVAGQAYYFVYTYNLVNEGDDYDSDYISGSLHFTAKSWDGIYAEDEAVLIGDEFVTDGLSDAGRNTDGTLYMHKEPDGSDVMAYVAVPFTPLHGGFLRIDSSVTNYPKTFRPLEDSQPSVCVNVVETPDQLEQDLQVTVSNLTYGLITEDDYQNGHFGKDMLSMDGKLNDLAHISMGRNYVVVEYDVTAEGADTGEVYCGIYVKDGYWSNMVLEQANTARTNKTDIDGGTMLDFAYTTPQNDTKRIRTVFSIDVLSVCSFDLEIFLYSDNTPITGTVDHTDCFIDASASKLTYRVDTDKKVAYVTGYETMTGTVVIPSTYEGYPVYGIDEGAFSDCTKLHTVRLNHVEKLNYSIFKNCTSLTDVDLGDTVTFIPSGLFTGCTALTTLNIPKQVCIMQDSIFEGCTSLSYVTFENPRTWTSSTKNYSLYVMDSPEENAKFLTNLVHFSISLLPTVKVENVSLGVVDAEAYESGNYEESIRYSFNQTMEKSKICYWILDMDVSFLTQYEKSYSWGIYLTCTDGYSIGVEEWIIPGLTYYDYNYDNHEGEYAIYVKYGEQNFEPTHLRFVLQVKPVLGGRRMTLYVSDACVMTDYGHFDKSVVFIPDIDISV